jgi:hypothetical protein
MTITTTIDGDVEGIRRLTAWLKDTVYVAVCDCTTRIYAARTNTAPDWTGLAGEAFRLKMSTGGKRADDLAQDIRTAARALDDYADALHTAQGRMERIRQAARDAGLRVTDAGILAPVPAAAEADATAEAGHARQTAAYEDAGADTAEVRAELGTVGDLRKNVLNELLNKPAFQAAFLADALDAGAAAHVASEHSFRARWRAIGAQRSAIPGATHRGQPYSDVGRSLRAADLARDTADTAGKWGRFARTVGGKVPMIGLGITAASTAYDITAGHTPAGKAIVTNGIGLGGSILAGAAVGSAIPVPVVGTIAGAVVGTAVGLGAGAAASAAWDALPDSVTGSIDRGFSAVGQGAKAAGHEAEHVWHALF